LTFIRLAGRRVTGKAAFSSEKKAMKTMRILVLIGIAVFCAAIAPAQNQPQRPQAFVAGERFFPALNRVLTEDQRQSFRTVLESQRDKIPPLEEKLRASRRVLLDAAVGGKFDETLVRQSAEAAAGAEAELTVIYVRALSQMQPPLSAQQIQQLKSFQPGQFQPQSGPAAVSAPEHHLELPPSLPRDTNDLPVVK
jgi:Spy/CpxP family protein refolding chaperone